MNICSEKFESWKKEQIASLIRTGHLEAAKKLNELSSIQWITWHSAWQASREALVIELPEFDEPLYHSPGSPNQHSAQGYNQALDQCRDAIHAAGVKTK